MQQQYIAYGLHCMLCISIFVIAFAPWLRKIGLKILYPLRRVKSSRPTKDEIFAAWQEFKEDELYSTLLWHVGETKAGCLWTTFYYGYYAGAKR